VGCPSAADHHAVLLVPELRRAEPGCAVLLVDEAGLAQVLHGAVDEPVLVERGLEEVLVEVDAEIAQVTILLGPEHLHGEAADRVERLSESSVRYRSPTSRTSGSATSAT
jgi:hypothetical protein